jgi:hypothetical protein
MDIFIDGVDQISFKEGMIRMALVSLSGEQPEVRRHLVMTLPAFLRALQAQQAAAARLGQIGILREPATDAPAELALAATRNAEVGSEAKPPRSPNFPDT